MSHHVLAWAAVAAARKHMEKAAKLAADVITAPQNTATQRMQHWADVGNMQRHIHEARECLKSAERLEAEYVAEEDAAEREAS